MHLSEIRRLSNLVQDLLDLARLEGRPAERTVVSLTKVVTQEAARVRPEAVEKGLTVREEVARGVKGDLYLSKDGLASGQKSSFTVDLLSLKSDESLRDRAMRGSLNTDKFPNATYTIESLTGEAMNGRSGGCGCCHFCACPCVCCN